jgi:hypothetical protein
MGLTDTHPQKLRLTVTVAVAGTAECLTRTSLPNQKNKKVRSTTNSPGVRCACSTLSASGHALGGLFC